MIVLRGHHWYTLALSHSRHNVRMSAAASSASEQIRIAVIGAGASGLAAARALQKHPHLDFVVFEQRPGPGGVWRYQTNQETTNSDAHTTTPMYRNLRTNLPKECMAFREFPFDDDRFLESYVTHKQVQEYLELYRDHFDLSRYKIGRASCRERC